jgi:hypothetical protein
MSSGLEGAEKPPPHVACRPGDEELVFHDGMYYTRKP